MNPLPFAATFDALAHIVEEVRYAASNAEFADMVPSLCWCFDNTFWEPRTGSMEHIPYEHYFIGWYRPEDVTDFVEVDILGTKVYVHRMTLDGLVGKRLVLSTVDSFGNPKVGSERKLLIAIADAA